jgi:membrane protein required for colicin V production
VDSLPFTVFDGIVLVVLLLSALLAFARGFVNEVLAVAAWLGAAAIVVATYPYVQPIARQYIEVPVIADVAAAASVFLVSVIVLSLISRALTSRIRLSALSGLDRSLGFVFGLARGAVIVCVAYLGISWLVPASEQPAWMTDAKSRPLVARGAEWLVSLLPEKQTDDALNRMLKTRDSSKTLETERLVRDMMEPKPKSPDAGAGDAHNGYQPAERRELERLLDSER